MNRSANTRIKCSVPGCNVDSSNKITFHKFPKDEKIIKLWMKACSITESIENKSICGMHFTKSDYTSAPMSKARKLKLKAIPSQNLPESMKDLIMLSEESPLIDNNPNSRIQTLSSKFDVLKPLTKPSNHRNTSSFHGFDEDVTCCIPQCTSKYSAKYSYYNFPKDSKLKEKWIKACKVNKNSGAYLHVCKDHFAKEDFLTSINSRRQILKAKAVPTQNLPFSTQSKAESKSQATTSKRKLSRDLSEEEAEEEEEEDITTIIYVPENFNEVISDHSKDFNTDLFNSPHSQSIDKPKNVQSLTEIFQKQNNVIIKKLKISDEPEKSINPTDIVTAKSNVENPVNQKSSNMKEDVLTRQVINLINPRMKQNSVKKIVANIPHDLGDAEEIFRSGAAAVTLCAECSQYCKIEDEDILYINHKNSATLAAQALMELQEINPSNENEQIILTKKGIEICDKAIRKENIHLTNLLTKDEELLAFTGVDSKLLDKLTKLVNHYEVIEDKFMNTKDRIVLCLCKIRINLSFSCLAQLFGITQQVCANNFVSTLQSLSDILQNSIYWTKTEELMKDLPKCFQSFKQTRVVLSCIENQIQKQRCFSCQLQVMVEKREYESVKLLLGVAPSGLITYKSSTFDGKEPNNAIFSKTDILDHLNRDREAIMVDRSLNIETECTENKITLIKPPKIDKDKLFTKQDVELVKNISAARIHVDRTLHRFKTYKIMQEKINWRIIPYIDEICTVIAGIVNLRNPIPPDEKKLKVQQPKHKKRST